MKRFSNFILALSTFFVASICQASPIEIGEYYEVIGAPKFFQSNLHPRLSPILEGSYLRFGEDEVFYLNLVTVFGTAKLEMGYDIVDFENGGNVRLRPSTDQDVASITNHLNNSPGEYDRELDTNMDGTVSAVDALLHINDLNSGVTSMTPKQIGIFDPNPGLDNFPLYTFLAASMDGIFRLDHPLNFFSIWTKQYDQNGEFLGQSDFILYAGENITSKVPEPATSILLTAGLFGGVLRRRRKAIT